MREAWGPQGPADKDWRKWKEEEEGSGAWALCGRAPPLSVSIAGGVRVTLHLGPSCSMGSLASAIVMVMGASHRDALPWPATQGPQRGPRCCPLGWGRMWPRMDAGQQPPPVLTAAKCTFQTQALTFLSPELQKGNGI